MKWAVLMKDSGGISLCSSLREAHKAVKIFPEHYKLLCHVKEWYVFTGSPTCLIPLRVYVEAQH